ncbi:MAG: peptidylprolyl isomerase [Gammaproteobacteria bacterium]
MTQAKSGDTVRVHYTGTLNNGSQFDSSIGREPLEVKLGSGAVIPGFDAALQGMQVGESKTVTIPAEQAYGEQRPEALQEYPRSALPEDLEIEVGMQLQGQMPNGQSVMLVVANVSDEMVLLDANHPLAGQDLTFDLELVEIMP